MTKGCLCSDKTIYQCMKMFKFKVYRAQSLFMDTVHLRIYVTRILYNYMTAFHNATVVINALQNLQSALSRAVLYIARLSVRSSSLSVRPSVTRVDQSKTVGEDYATFTVQLHAVLAA